MGARQESDVNRERLIFCCMSLVGHKVTAKLRNSIIYEGLFHSCCFDGDYSITLRCARQTSPQNGRVIGTLVIPGKDFLQISAMNVPPLPASAREAAGSGTGFVTDAEISQTSKWGAASHDRELVPWAGGSAVNNTGPVATSNLEEGSRSRNWNQFEANESMLGLQTTFNEELYITKLDPQTIPREKREEAERIAREIEAGPTISEMEEKLEAPEDEEETFSAVARGVASSNRDSGRDLAVVGSGSSAFAVASKGVMGSERLGTAAPQSEMATASGGQVALTKEHLSQHDSWAGSGLAGDGFALEHRTKRGMITAHSPMIPPMVSEMKRINALNLEPALPKLDDKTRNAWINFKQSQTRNASKSASGSGLKMEFEQSLQAIQQRQLSKQQDQPPEQPQQQDGGSAVRSHSPVAAGGASYSSTAGAGGAMLPRRSSASNPAAGNPSRAIGDTGGDSSRSSKFTFNPGAKEFSFNPQAATFTSAVGSSPSGGGGAASPQARAQGTSLQFHAANHDAKSRPLREILDYLLDHARHEPSELVTLEWAEAVGLPFREVLGRPHANGPPALVLPAGAVPGTGPGSWQQQVVASGASAGSQGQPGQMYPQMYAAPGSGVSGQRSPGGGQGGMMSPQGGQMGPGSKFGGQVGIPVMVPSGQYGPQGFVPQGQPGPGGGQSGQVMMNPGGAMIMQPMYPRQQMSGACGGGQSQTSSGHDG